MKGKANGVFIVAMTLLLTLLIPLGIRLKLVCCDVPVLHYVTAGLGGLLYYVGAMPFYLVNVLFKMFLGLDLYAVPVVGGIVMVIAVSFTLWWILLVLFLGSGGEKMLKKNVRFV